jgi:hypothetical protein
MVVRGQIRESGDDRKSFIFIACKDKPLQKVSPFNGTRF